MNEATHPVWHITLTKVEGDRFLTSCGDICTELLRSRQNDVHIEIVMLDRDAGMQVTMALTKEDTELSDLLRERLKAASKKVAMTKAARSRRPRVSRPALA